MDVKELTENEYDKVIELLSSAVKNKKYAQPEDLQRACVLFYSVNKLGFVLVDLDVNSIIKNHERIILNQQKNSLDTWQTLVMILSKDWKIRKMNSLNSKKDFS